MPQQSDRVIDLTGSGNGSTVGRVNVPGIGKVELKIGPEHMPMFQENPAAFTQQVMDRKFGEFRSIADQFTQGMSPLQKAALSEYVRMNTEKGGIPYAQGSAPVMRSGAPQTSMQGVPYQGTPEMTKTQQAAYMTMPMPVVGDLTGLAADVQMYMNDPDSRSLANYFMTGLGVLGLGASIPPVSVMRNIPSQGGLLMDKKASAQGDRALQWAAENPPLQAPGRQQPTDAFDGVTEIGGKKYMFNQQAIAQEYPPVGDPILSYDQGKDKFYWGKNLTPIEKELQKARNAASKDIKAGNYTPYFDSSQRADVDYSNYDTGIDTKIVAQPATQKTIDKYRSLYDTAKPRENLQRAFDLGKDLTSADRWYFMKQLEDEFVKEFGPVEGRKLFKERFADSMATTTGGADPTANLLSSAYVNNIQALGGEWPVNAYQMPHPIGGRFISGNVKFAQKGEIDPAEHPKRHNFSHNFLGNTNNATIDEQMSSAWGFKAPPDMSYGVFEEVLSDVARQNGVDPRGFQDVAWAGLKSLKEPGYQGMPMIDHVNEAIERTARITGKTPQEVVRDSILHAKAPLYGVGGAALLGGMYYDRIREDLGLETEAPGS
jgi:hypothetical protein